MRFLYFFLTLSFLIIFQSCKQDTDAKVEESISKLIDKFPQFRKGKSKQTEYYKLQRSVTFGENEFQLQLRSEPDSINDPQKILVLINSKSECRAIPFFSNTFGDYWEFVYCNPIQEEKRANTTFNKEFSSALELLKLDTFSIGSRVIYELFGSLLQCESITEIDSLVILAGMGTINKVLEDDYLKNETRERFQKNYDDLVHYWQRQANLEDNYETYYDFHNARIYLIHMSSGYYDEPFKLTIRNYKQNGIYNGFSM